ncbi:MAG: formate dehydrogenase accessory protein FdhE [Bradyrhizobium sp.]|uniref:formate dehydrogenase accessory protein FdhE n=1 Tax=Bradyrhizobium sp. TaxID=376 RepID=UPI0025C2349C|nr:formate dehydrogenase accessory protein FdhE [Bradyrhizobium sp.]MBI5261858.1 formate dehydrogenase accessory protein FdhE [Bradyrhizobium sp.]
MSKTGVPLHNPVPIGNVAKPAFAVLPDPASVFLHRASRFRALSATHQLGPYLGFLAGLSEVQHRLQDGLPEPEVPPLDVRERARHFNMPPVDRSRFVADPAFDAALDRLLELAAPIEMPAQARLALTEVREAGADARDVMMRAVLADAIPVETLARHVFVTAALQVHMARVASRLDPNELVAVGDAICPVCGGPPVASVIVGWQHAANTRYCVCSLCQTWWHYVRIRCTCCGSTKGIGYKEIEGAQDGVQAETCEECHGYAKILHQHKHPELDPVADDVATLALDLLVREGGYRRGAFNPYLLGY